MLITKYTLKFLGIICVFSSLIIYKDNLIIKNRIYKNISHYRLKQIQFEDGTQ